MKKQSGQSRQGKHKDGKSSIGLYVDDDNRALLALASDLSGKTGTDILIAGIAHEATALGIIENGAVTEKFKPVIEIIKNEIVKQRNERKLKK